MDLISWLINVVFGIVSFKYRKDTEKTAIIILIEKLLISLSNLLAFLNAPICCKIAINITNTTNKTNTTNTTNTINIANTINTTTKTITYVYAYGTSTAMTSLAANTTTTNAVFNSVTLAPTLTSAQKTTAPAIPNIVVNAYGIQIDNLSASTPSGIFALFN